MWWNKKLGETWCSKENEQRKRNKIGVRFRFWLAGISKKIVFGLISIQIIQPNHDLVSSHKLDSIDFLLLFSLFSLPQTSRFKLTIFAHYFFLLQNNGIKYWYCHHYHHQTTPPPLSRCRHHFTPVERNKAIKKDRSKSKSTNQGRRAEHW